MEKYFVVYDTPLGCRVYNAQGCSRQQADALIDTFNRKYVGKRYPNARAMYPYTNPRIAPVWQPA